MKATLPPARTVARIGIATGALLLIPLTLTLLNRNATLYGGPGGGWDWMPGDFIAMGALMFAAGYAGAVALRSLATPLARSAAVGGIFCVLVLLWVELAVDGVTQFITRLSQSIY